MKVTLCAIVLAATCVTAPAAAAEAFGAGVRVGTLGVGIEASWQPLPYLDLRIGGNTFELDDTGIQSGIPYDSTLTLETAYVAGSFHFPDSPMRVTAGVYANGNELLMINDDGNDLDIGGIVYPGAGIGTLTSVTSFASTAPYIGIGFDITLKGRLGMTLDLGMLLQGEPEVTLMADGALAQDPLFQASLEAERRQLENEMNDLKVWPVLSLGLVYRF